MKTFFPILLLLATTGFAQTPAPTLRSLFVEDQRDRGQPLADDGVSTLPKEEASKLPTYDFEKEVPARDQARREKARALLAQPGLTGVDYYFAAFLFQHGQEANDYLFAHVLATEAVALGYTRAKWISAATLDRYLQTIGQKQIFGTQYVGENYAYYLQHRDDKDVLEKFKTLTSQQTLAPYAPQIVPDAIRAEFCVPPLSVQEQHIADVKAGKAKPNDLPRIENCKR
jgi:hypothetical protein